MLFFFGITTNKLCSSPNRVALVLLFVLFVCCLLPSISNAYPFYSPSFSVRATEINSNSNQKHLDEQRRIAPLGDEISTNDDYSNVNLERNGRGTGFIVVRDGDTLIFIPDPRHHFSKTVRPYIGR